MVSVTIKVRNQDYFFFLCVAILVSVSLSTPAESEEKIQGLTFGTLTEEQKAADRNSFNWIDIVASLIIIGVVIYVMTSFTGS